MKFVGSRLAKIAFNKLLRLSGSPKLTVIEPIANWNVADNLTYNAKRDQFLTPANTAVAVAWQGQPSLELAFLPQPQQNEVDLALPGLVTQAKTSVTVLWSAETQAAIDAAWGVAIGGKLYRVDRWTLIPVGVAKPNSIDLELVEAKK